ncbi:MAG: hypothetical protein C4538_00205 [Nitrospiraceae bacterium]|nr:MAG: hypothetical protein C4538_00205 [Nitrospiraceae bacterium]
MTTLFNKLLGTFLGVEFRDETLEIVFMRNGVSGMSLLSSSSFPLKADDANLAEIRGYINRLGEKPDRVFVSIPDKWAITKFTDIPSIKGKGKDVIVNMMRFEIERHIPFNIEEVSFDFLVLDEKAAAYSVVFVTVHKEKMEYVKDFLEKLSLRPNTVIPSSFAVLNTLELSDITAGGLLEVMGIMRRSRAVGKSGETNIFLYFDKAHACMSVLKDGLYIYHRSLTYRIGQEHGAFMNDISRYLAEIQSRYSVERFHTLILSGDMNSVTEVIHELKEKTGINIVTLDQISNLSGNTNKTDINMLASAVGACFGGLGLATYRVNLLPHKMEYETRKTVPLSTKIFFVLIFVLIIGIFATEAYKKRQYLSNVEAVLKKNQPMVSGLEKLTADINGIQERIDVLRNLKNSEITLELLTEITGLMPKDAWITNLEFKAFEPKDKKKGLGELILSGQAASSSALIPLLEDSTYLEKVALVGPVKKTGDKEQFKLGALIVLPGKKKEPEPSEKTGEQTAVQETEQGKGQEIKKEEEKE